jgi:hypothetical protein
MEPRFQIGELVKVKLTGEKGMVIETYDRNTHTGNEIGYQVRLSNSYAIANMFEYELEEWKDEDNKA